VTNIRGDVLLGLWDAFLEHRIEIPFPQRDLHVRDLPAAAASRIERTQARDDKPSMRAPPAPPNSAKTK
jgi:small-conductance mechanosensitive channel